MSGTHVPSPSQAPRVVQRDPLHPPSGPTTPDVLDAAPASARPSLALRLGGALFALAWLVFALRLAFPDLERQVLAADELHAINVVNQFDYDEIWTHYDTSDNSIPYSLYIEWLVEKRWFSELNTRLPAVVSTLLLFLAPFLFVRWIRWTGALVALALFATSPLIVFYAIVARPYAPAALAMTLAIASWGSWITRPRFLPLLGFVVASVAAVFLHLYCLFSVFALLAIAALASRKGPVRFRAAFGGGLAIGAGIAALYLPGLEGLIEHRVGKVGGGGDLYETLVRSYRTLNGELEGVALLLPILALAGWFALARRAPLVGAGLAGVVVFQVLAMCATHPVGELNVFARYFFPVLPALLLLAAAGIEDLARRGLEIVAPRASVASRVAASSALALALGSALAGLLPAKSPILLFRDGRTSLRSGKESLLDATAYLGSATPVFRHVADDRERGDVLLAYPGFDYSETWGDYRIRGLRDIWVVRACDRDLVQYLRESGLAYEHALDVENDAEVRASGAKYLVVDLARARPQVVQRMHHDFGRPVARDELNLLFDLQARGAPR